MALIDGEYYYRPPAKKTVAKKAVYYPAPAAKPPQVNRKTQWFQDKGEVPTTTAKPIAPRRPLPNPMVSIVQGNPYKNNPPQETLRIESKTGRPEDTLYKYRLPDGSVSFMTQQSYLNATRKWGQEQANKKSTPYNITRRPGVAGTYYANPPAAPNLYKMPGWDEAKYPSKPPITMNQYVSPTSIPTSNADRTTPSNLYDPNRQPYTKPNPYYQIPSNLYNPNAPVYTPPNPNYLIPSNLYNPNAPVYTQPNPNYKIPSNLFNPAYPSAIPDIADVPGKAGTSMPASPWASTLTPQNPPEYTNYSTGRYNNNGMPAPTPGQFNLWGKDWAIPMERTGMPWVVQNPASQQEANARFPFRNQERFDQSVIPMGLTPNHSSINPYNLDPWASDPYDAAGGGQYYDGSLEPVDGGGGGGGGYGGWGGWGGGGGGGGSYGASSGVNSYLPGAGGGYGARASNPNYTGGGGGRAGGYAGVENYNPAAWRMPMLVWNI